MKKPSTQRAPWPIRMKTAPHFMAWAAVLAIALLSFFVHTVHDGLGRGETLRAAQRGGAGLPNTSTKPADWPRGAVAPAQARSNR